MSGETFRIRVLPGKHLSLVENGSSRAYAPGEEIELPADEATELARQGLAAIVVEGQVVGPKPKPQEAAEPPKEVAVKSVFA
jgi:hypothetical protein